MRAPAPRGWSKLLQIPPVTTTGHIRVDTDGSIGRQLRELVYRLTVRLYESWCWDRRPPAPVARTAARARSGSSPPRIRQPVDAGRTHRSQHLPDVPRMVGSNL